VHVTHVSRADRAAEHHRRLLVPESDELGQYERLSSVGVEAREQVVDGVRGGVAVAGGVPAELVDQPSLALTAAHVVSAHPSGDGQQPGLHGCLATVCRQRLECTQVRVLHQIGFLACGAERCAQPPHRGLCAPYELCERHVVTLHRCVEQVA
jgi:hypothetical protein